MKYESGLAVQRYKDLSGESHKSLGRRLDLSEGAFRKFCSGERKFVRWSELGKDSPNDASREFADARARGEPWHPENEKAPVAPVTEHPEPSTSKEFHALPTTTSPLPGWKNRRAEIARLQNEMMGSDFLTLDEVQVQVSALLSQLIEEMKAWIQATPALDLQLTETLEQMSVSGAGKLSNLTRQRDILIQGQQVLRRELGPVVEFYGETVNYRDLNLRQDLKVRQDLRAGSLEHWL